MSMVDGLADGKRGDKTEFAEKLGTMNKRWQTVTTRVLEEKKKLELLLKGWKDYEKAVADILELFAHQEMLCRKCEGRVGHETSVQSAVNTCEVSLVYLVHCQTLCSDIGGYSCD